jgi:ABC-2 type transport system permease protein
LLASIVYGLVIAVSAGMLVLALSSLSRNSRYVALLWIGVWVVSTIVFGVLESAYQQQRMQRMWAAQQQIVRGQPPTDSFLAAEIEAAKKNWRPLVSYTANLSRVGQELLGTDRVWKKLSELQPAHLRDQFLLRSMGPQYPWYWSAGVLLALFVLSAWILNRSIKSLDRLR